MATFLSSYYTILSFDGGTYTATTDSVVGNVSSFDNEVPGGGQPGAETFETGDNIATTGAISGGGQYVGFYGDGYIGNQGGTYYYFSNSPVSGGVEIPVDTGDFDVVCFLQGTLIATPDGEVPVETLRAGDLVIARHRGRTGIKPLIWVGHMEAAIPRGTAGHRAAPVTFCAGSLGDGMPFRDLRVSPEHAVLVERVLVPARLLVNGETILQDSYRRTASYYHLELEEHGLLLADGAWSESYLDDDNRHLFGNIGITTLLGEDDPAPAYHDSRACLPIVRAGPELDRIRLALASRTQRLGKAA